MDAAVELAKCREAAEKAVKGLIGVIDPGLARVTTERFTTALLEARADALREFTSGWCYIADELEQEALARMVRGL